MEWKPIETAPKDGMHILAWADGLPVISEYSDGQWWTDDDRYNDLERNYPCRFNPTHWMPLPAPPLPLLK